MIALGIEQGGELVDAEVRAAGSADENVLSRGLRTCSAAAIGSGRRHLGGRFRRHDDGAMTVRVNEVAGSD